MDDKYATGLKPQMPPRPNRTAPRKKRIDWWVFTIDWVTGAGVLFWEAFWAMLMLGIAHSADKRIPAFGYWVCLALVLALSGAVFAGNFNSFQRICSLTKGYGKK